MAAVTMAALARWFPRPNWDNLRKLGVTLRPEHFLVVGKPLTYGFKVTQAGEEAPADLTPLRLRQFYDSRKVDAKPELVEALRTRTTLPLLTHSKVKGPVAVTARVKAPAPVSVAGLGPLGFDSPAIPAHESSESVPVVKYKSKR